MIEFLTGFVIGFLGCIVLICLLFDLAEKGY